MGRNRGFLTRNCCCPRRLLGASGSACGLCTGSCGSRISETLDGGLMTIMRDIMAVAGLVGALSVAVPAFLIAQGPEWSFTAQSAVPLALPTPLDTDSLRSALSYDVPGQRIAGFLADINADGTQDYVLRSSLDVCGSNCGYLLVDGLSTRVLGRVGGSVIFVTPPVINDYPVIRTYGHSSADAGYWTTHVFDGATYVPAGTVYLEGDSQRQLFDSLRSVPSWPR